MTLISWNQNPAKCLSDTVMDLELLGDLNNSNLPLEATLLWLGVVHILTID